MRTHRFCKVCQTYFSTPIRTDGLFSCLCPAGHLSTTRVPR